MKSMSFLRSFDQHPLDFSIDLKSPTISSPEQEEISLDLGVFSSSGSGSGNQSRSSSSKSDYDMIDKRVQPLIVKLQSFEVFYDKLQGGKDMRNILALKDLNDKVMDTCIQIFECYNVMFGYISEMRTDSALTVVPLSASVEVYQCLRSLVSILVMFPYSFFHNLGLNKLTVCDEMILLKPEHKGIYKQKLLGGLMPLKQVNNKDSINRYLLLVIVYYMQQRIPQMHVDWVCAFWSSYKKKLTNMSTIILEDQYKALDALMKYFSQNRKFSDETLKEKALKMRRYLLSIDATMFSCE